MIRCLENFEAGSFSVGKVKNLRAGRTGPKAWLHDLLPGRKGPLQQPTKPKLMSSIPRLVVSTAMYAHHDGLPYAHLPAPNVDAVPPARGHLVDSGVPNPLLEPASGER